MIGIFDSGSGGLTVLKALRTRMPSSDVTYFGDIANAPYGEKSRVSLNTLTIAAIERLQGEGASSIVSACNSVSASLAISLFDTLSLAPDRLIEMVGPTASHFRTFTGNILLCATPATVASSIYQDAFRMLGKEVTAVPIPHLAGAIEEGRRGAELESMIDEAFAHVPLSDFDVLILACTHYPLAFPEFRDVCGALPLFDPADAVAERVYERWWPRETGSGALHFLITRDSEPFRDLVAEFFPTEQYSIDMVPSLPLFAS